MSQLSERRDVQRSKLAIKQAFFELSTKKEVQKITVKEILELANVSRGTFYAHYQDVFDVQRQVEKDILDECRQVLNRDLQTIQTDSYEAVLAAVRFLFAHSETIRSFYANGQIPSFVREFQNILKSGLRSSLYPDQISDVQRIHTACIASSIVDGCLEVILDSKLGADWNEERTAQAISDFFHGR